MKYKIFFLVFIFLIIGSTFNVNAQPFEIFKGKLAPGRFIPSKSADEYHLQAESYFEAGNYPKALLCYLLIIHHFKNNVHCSSALKQVAFCYVRLGKPDLADRYLSQYVEINEGSANFQDVCHLKYMIAQSYAKGTKKHLYGLEGLPRLENAQDDALRIYNEIISSFPAEEVAAKSLFGKAVLLMIQKKYDDSIKIFQMLIRQFPESSLSPDSFVNISKIYLIQSLSEPQNSKYLSSAANNLIRMKELYPGVVQKIAAASLNLQKIRENSAEGLYRLGRFYEKKRKILSARIYYKNAVNTFPETLAAGKCRERIDAHTGLIFAS
ncbi:MAG: tetratricopeptide repeat protein [Victivallaceae bacterium]